MSKRLFVDVKAQQILALYRLIEILLRQLPPGAERQLRRLSRKRTKRAVILAEQLKAIKRGEQIAGAR